MNNIYKYRLRSILRDRGNLFWTFLFPILLATFFSMSFGSALENSEVFEAVPVAVVQDADAQPYFSQTIDALGTEGVLDVKNVDASEAQQLLDSGDVTGIYEVSDDISLTVSSSGISQSILKSVLDSYLQVESTITNIMQSDPQAFAQNPQLATEVIGDITDGASVTQDVGYGGSYNYFFQNFYALLAMTCLYGSFFGLSGVISLQGNLSPLGARRTVAPASKTKLMLGDMLAGLTVMFAIILVFMAYMRFVLGIDMGGNVPAVMLIGFLGCFVGVLLGMFIGSASRLSAGMKDGILIGGSLTLSFLGGMMYPMVRYDIEQVAPIVNRLNPAALIVDSLYSLDTYGVGARYWTNVAWLVGIGVVLFVVSVVALRRRQYESI